jgi:hypothetical protein
MELTEGQSRVLNAVLRGLLPGTDVWPSAAGLGLEGRVAELAALDPDHPAILDGFLAALPDGFEELSDAERRHEVLQSMEASLPDAFGVVLVLAYNAYYTNPQVLTVVSERTGYAARAPQPEGYELDPFDESSLETVRQREPFWRQV